MQDLGFVYENELIYRTMIVCNECNMDVIKNLLEKEDYSVFVMDTIEKSLDYESMDFRVLIVSCEMFKDAIEHFEGKYGLGNISYNFIAFAHDIDDDISAELKGWVQGKTNKDIIFI